MRRDCRRIEEALAEGRSLNDTELEHVESCEHCRRLTETLEHLDTDLVHLRTPTPDDLAERTMGFVARETARPVQRDGLWAYLGRRSIATAATLLLCSVIIFVVTRFVPGGPIDQVLVRTQSAASEAGGTRGPDARWRERSLRAPRSSDRPEAKGQSGREAGGESPESAVWLGYASPDPESPEPARSGEGGYAISMEDRGHANLEDGFLDSAQFRNRETEGPDVQLADKKRALRRAYEQHRDESRAELNQSAGERRDRDAAEAGKRAREVAGSKAEQNRPARSQAERDRLARHSASNSAEPPPAPAPARGLSSKDQWASQAPPASRAPAEVAADEFELITGGFQAEYGEQSTGIADIVMEDRVADAEADHADSTFSTASFAAYPDADGRSLKAKARKSDAGAADAIGEDLSDRRNDQVGEKSQGVGGAPFRDPNAPLKSPLFSSLGKNEAENEKLVQDARGQAKGVGLDGPEIDGPEVRVVAGARIERADMAASVLDVDAASVAEGAGTAGAHANLIEQMGFGALGYEPEAWKGVSLDRPVYFENTYLGGNARMAWLDRRAASLQLAGKAVAPHRVVGLPEQPFDAPERGAVALHVDASEAHVSAGEPRRVFLQVGIAGTEDAAWRRPPASVVVLPLLSNTREAEASATIATLRAGLEERDLLAFVPASGRLAFSSPAEAGTETVGVAPDEARKALRGLAQSFAGVEGGNSLRTRRLVILADRPVGDDLRRLVHRLALKDVVTSVVSIGRQGEDGLETHAAIAQAGQGNLHLVDRADGLSAALDDELDSLTRVVARALRLNIRPAESVRLIQVLGSRPLAKREVKEVKAREKAVDRAVERKIGISSDRGADDPGLQTVLPYFLAGDRHVVIVELEVDGPGPLADVSLKIKDLVEMENRSLRASASISRTPAERTPRQQQVRRNVAGFAVAKILRDAEVELAIGGSARPDRLRAFAEQLLADPLVASEADARLLETYARMLSEGSDRRALAASIECARLARLGRATP